MASLLDFVLQRRNPRLGGLLDAVQSPGPLGGLGDQNPRVQQPSVPPPNVQQGVRGVTDRGPQIPQATPPESQRGGISGALASIFSGEESDVLSPEQNRTIDRNALFLTGLGTIASEGRPLQRVAQGAILGRQSAVANRGRAVQAQNEKLIRAEEARAQARLRAVRSETGEILDNPEGLTRADVNRAIAFALGENDLEGVAELRELGEGLPEEPGLEPLQPIKDVGNGVPGFFDPNARAFFKSDGTEVVEATPVAGPQDDVQMVDLQNADGEQVTGFANLTQQTFTPLDGFRPISEGDARGASRQAILDAADATKMRLSFDIVEDFLTKAINENPENPLQGLRFDRARFEQSGILLAPNVRKGLDPQVQSFLNAQENFMFVLANQLAGVKGITQEEARNSIFRTFFFEEGDLVDNIEQSLRQLQVDVVKFELIGAEALGLFDSIRIAGEEQQRGITGAVSDPDLGRGLSSRAAGGNLSDRFRNFSRGNR